ncbi:T9SS type A sorting domain-containing protein [Desertivirga xinjiangensis]|uniref:T9SS type A sorting domain-containing protein n=1 Tax=Desertivirga xinjiangensis TaxID=539206 RepID=UPI00210C588A|nr:T9SS type A sorting domain-containing protein [Pedobacter xinjiangensis]
MRKRFTLSIFTFIILACVNTAISYSVPAGTIRYVKEVASGAGTGLDWGNASADLQAMINISAEGDQVWVAAGTYYPTVMAGDGTGARDKAFMLKKGVEIYGGFAGSEALLSERNFVTNITKLSGDLDKSGTFTTSDSYHVVLSSGDVGSARLDGFTITGGNASSTITPNTITYNGNVFPKYAGGGIYIRNSDPTISNLIVVGNRCLNSPSLSNGGGLYMYNSSSVLTNIMVSNNSAGNSGGGLYLTTSSAAVLNNVSFENNRSGSSAGGMYIYNSSPLITKAIFANNEAVTNGGAIFIYGSSATNVSTPVIQNAVFYNNKSLNTTAGDDPVGGGAVYSSSRVNAIFTNTTFYGNTSALQGGAIVLGYSSSYVQVNNSIFYSNVSGVDNHDIHAASPSNLTLNNSLTQQTGVSGSDGNIVGQNPSFISTDPSNSNFLRLSVAEGAVSPAIDKGSDSYITGITTDLAGNPRKHGSAPVDMGAYENQDPLPTTMPVDLISFTSKKQSTSALLSWSTASETNNDRFLLERSGNGTLFTYVTEIAAKPEVTGVKNYSYIDYSPVNGDNYYRLTQIDKNGTATVKGVEVINFALFTAEINAYPNPTSDKIVIALGDSKYDKAVIFDSNGRVLTSKTIQHSNVDFNLTTYANGIYFVELTGPSGRITKKIIRN